jgi:type II secretory ATPase GspE/PulE/Tfp pilus assembly ATPase PilB-like protein
VKKTKAETLIIENIFRDIWMKWVDVKNVKLYAWEGCSECNWTGYKWRVWVYEIINLNENLRNIIREWATVDQIMEEARKNDMITMKEDGILKAIKWYTTIEEILRVL